MRIDDVKDAVEQVREGQQTEAAGTSIEACIHEMEQIPFNKLLIN